MNAYPNVERIESGPAWMDKTAYTEEQRLAERADIWREQEEAAAQPVINAIRTLGANKLTQHAAVAILRALSCCISESAWAGTDAGETAVGTLDDLSDDLNPL